MAHTHPVVNTLLGEPCPPWQPSGDVPAVPLGKGFVTSCCASGPRQGPGGAGISRTAPSACSQQAYVNAG